ncbi:hypothetical protein V2J09_019665 [Rumex salicifolius]
MTVPPILYLLTDDLLARIRSKLDDESDRKSFRLVCKAFNRVDSMSRTHLRILRPEFAPSLLPKFPAVESLDLSVCPRFDGAAVANLLHSATAGGSANWTRGIRSLILRRVNGLRYYGFQMLIRACSERLEMVDISFCFALGDRALQAMSCAAGLRDLRLDKCSNVTDVGLAHIAVGCSGLERLSLKWCLEITDLGIDLLTKKCLKLKFLDISYLEVTSESLRSISCLEKLEGLVMVGCSTVDDAGLRFLGNGCPLLKVLSVSRCDGITSAGLCAVAEGHVGLLKLNACHSMVDLSSKFLNCLKNLRSLTTLKVDGARVSHSIFETISITCKSLVEIGLSKCIGLTDIYVTDLVTGCSNLKTLNLSCCDSITDDAISAIADSCRELVSLQLESCNFITERSLKLLGLYCVLLEALDFTDCCGVNDTALKYLSRCSNLKCLKMGLCNEISDKGLFYIASNCSKIVELDLYRCPGIGDDGLAAISNGCKKLKKLNVSYCTRLTDRGIEYIGRLKELVDLDMRSLEGVHGSGLTAIAAGCEKLAELDLKHCKNIQDMAFCALAYYSKNLRQINLSHCAISDVALCLVMSNLSSLQVAKLVQLTNISTGALEIALKACCGRLKKVKLHTSRKLTLSSELSTTRNMG